MPHELSAPNPPAAQEHVITNADLIWQDVVAQDGFSSYELNPGTWTPLEYGELAPMVSNGHTYQNLRGLVKAGHEVFGVVQVMGKDIEGVQTMITRVSQTPGDRASLVGFVDKEKGLIVGRTGDADPRMSREHFMVGFTPEGELSVKDLLSTNKTEIIVQDHKADAAPAESAIPSGDELKGKVFLKATKNLLRSRRAETQPEIAPNPLRDWNVWSVKTAKVRAESPKSNKERNDWLEQQLNDPEKPLPKVSLRLVVDPDEEKAVEKQYEMEDYIGHSDDKKKTYEVRNSDNEPVGAVRLVDPYMDGKKAPKQHIGMIRITDRKQGYGPSTYLEILKSLPEGVGLESDNVLTEGSTKAWERLVERGVARRIVNDYGSNARYETVF